MMQRLLGGRPTARARALFMVTQGKGKGGRFGGCERMYTVIEARKGGNHQLTVCNRSLVQEVYRFRSDRITRQLGEDMV
jgi:hypothetical protein